MSARLVQPHYAFESKFSKAFNVTHGVNNSSSNPVSLSYFIASSDSLPRTVEQNSI